MHDFNVILNATKVMWIKYYSEKTKIPVDELHFRKCRNKKKLFL